MNGQAYPRKRRVGLAVCSAWLVAFPLSLLHRAHGEQPQAAFATRRGEMVSNEIEAAGVTDPRVLSAMRATPRHEFVPAGFREYAYFDAALPIGDRQTISPPYVVAYMTAQLDPQPTDRVLEIGTGSGYQAAVLSPLVRDVYTIEIVAPLGRRAEQTLKRLGYKNVHVRVGDGFKGWPEHAPFDKIIVTCSPEKIPQPLVDQLREGGQMIIPVGERYQQNLIRVTKSKGHLQREPLQATLFVPMTGQAEEDRQVQPDPARPAIRNGGFEQMSDPSGDVVAWHYLRQATVANESSAPEGKRWLSFTNASAGRASQALQGLALDGRRVSRIRISCQAAGRDLAGADDQSRPGLIITFYDDRRAAIDNQRLGDWSGSFAWRRESKEFRVPLAAREAIVRVGLHGATGTLDIDDVRVAPVAPAAPRNSRRDPPRPADAAPAALAPESPP